MSDFDRGDEEEACRIALELRKLLHDTKVSHSILQQLGVKQTLDFYDSGRYRSDFEAAANAFAERELGPQTRLVARSPVQVGLVFAGMSGGDFIFYAPLGLRYQQAKDWRAGGYRAAPRSFTEWWTDPLVETTTGETFSRKDLVLTTANQEGGAHVDPEVDLTFDRLLKDMMGISMVQGGSPLSILELHKLGEGSPKNNAVYPSIRQIAHEVLATLRSGYKCIRKTPIQEFMYSEPFGRIAS
ncbi:hypothetical protein [Rhizobium changzhiense]|uniref:Uncharacterized protein n=1 Tax=Rhizobium changzhiense TaxID=2692317 RepID=A0ABR6ABQ1_9HYPH|nr:hypothetical protein [Rhizobium changzhiense]MBA5804026.1 hypothetical protein [Rhizobium changzhiense]